ncbi:isochorismatase family protein [Stutzerimonas stutzeri]|uniref:isochorismatase family protein n=1 Tax=Pseudomonadaceae TaxID=135621 RepID=UPI0018A91D13|nr:isochorismatase family protein [Stutzerimonas stutzeri]QPI11902.1 cysteine hydrolase [Stutzerimonas stutzeri]
MRQVLLIVDVQTAFCPPDWLVKGIQALANQMPSVATIELHDEETTPFQSQLGWSPPVSDQSLVHADQLFVKHGFCPSAATMQHLKQLNPERVLVCGIQTETCVLAAGYSLFDAGLRPTLITDLTVGSSLDRSGQLGISLWKHHFRQTVSSRELAMELNPGGTPRS